MDKSSEAWKRVFEANPRIAKSIERDGLCEVTASQIKKFREPRLMTKHDSTDGVPEPLAKNHWNVLSTSRSGYVVGEFDVFSKFPTISSSRPEFCDFPDYETLDIDHISSESNAINALVIAGILDRFIGTEDLVETFNGRMGTDCFDFNINRNDGGSLPITVRNAQLEIDGGFESDDCVVIIEAKNVLHDDFNVRQLYYPFRKYSRFVKKPIRLVFAQYTNLQYNLFEFKFDDPNNFSSITYLRGKSYTFEDDRITADDIWSVWQETKVVTDDNVDCMTEKLPFPQADRIDRIISLIEYLSDRPDGASTEEIAEHMGTVVRQANYYPSAAQYLGLVDRRPNVTALTVRAKKLLKGNRRNRFLEIVRAMFEHEIFHRLYSETVHSGNLPEKNHVIETMRELNVLGEAKESMFRRRASTVIGWLRWLCKDLPED